MDLLVRWLAGIDTRLDLPWNFSSVRITTPELPGFSYPVPDGLASPTQSYLERSP